MLYLPLRFSITLLYYLLYYLLYLFTLLRCFPWQAKHKLCFFMVEVTHP